MKKFLYLVILLVVVGMWLGYNLAMERPLFSNPFAEPEVQEKAAQEVKKFAEGARATIERKVEETMKK